MEIRDAIRQLAGKGTERVLVAEVISVDEETLTCNCSPLDGTADLLDINLSIDTDDSGLIAYIPKVGGMVVVVMTGETSGYVVQSTIGKMIINGGKNGGLINIKSLVEKVNALEDEINNLKTVFTNWVPVAQDGGSALKTACATWSGTQMVKTKRKDIEDTNITH